jgi:hypothetical protein
MQLVINTFGASLRRKGDQFVVRAGSNRMAVSAQKVTSILVARAVHLSSDALVLAVAQQHRRGVPGEDRRAGGPRLATADGLDGGDPAPATRI